MRILEVKNINREDGYIYYMRKFTAQAMIQIPGNVLEEDITFNIETDPFGLKTIEVNFNNDINYPLLPIKKALIDYITQKDLEGTLP